MRLVEILPLRFFEWNFCLCWPIPTYSTVKSGRLRVSICTASNRINVVLRFFSRVAILTARPGLLDGFGQGLPRSLPSVLWHFFFALSAPYRLPSATPLPALQRRLRCLSWTFWSPTWLPRVVYCASPLCASLRATTPCHVRGARARISSNLP